MNLSLSSSAAAGRASPASRPAVQVAAFAAAVVAVLWAIILLEVRDSHREVTDSATQEAAALIEALDAHTNATLGAAHQLVGRVARDMQGDRFPTQAMDPATLTLLRTAIADVPAVTALGVFGGDGILRNWVVRTSAGGAQDVGDAVRVENHDYVTRIDALPASASYVGVPLRAGPLGHWVLPVSRPVRDAVGAFQGGVVALIRLDTFTGLFSRVRVAEDGIVSLRRDDDGALLARAPFVESLIGGLGDRALPLDRLRATPPGQAMAEVVDRPDGQWLVSYKRADDFPVHVVVANPLSSLTAGWRQQMLRGLMIGAALTLVVAGMAVGMIAQWRRRAVADAALADSRGALQAMVERMDRAIAGSTAAIWEFDLRPGQPERPGARGGGYLSPQWHSLLGWGEIPNPYAHWRDSLHPDDRDRVLAALEAHLAHRGPFDVEYRLRAANGGYRWVHGRGQASWDAAGRPTLVSGTVHDITPLHQGEERLRLALEAANESLWDWDLRTGSLFLDDRWKSLFGFRPDLPTPATPRAALALAHPEDLHALFVWTRDLLRGAQGVHAGEFRIRRGDGAWAWVRVAAKISERDHHGYPVRVVGLNRDVTRRREESRQLRDAKEQAELASRAKSEFLANMSHELRTPLNAICGFAEALDLGTFGPLAPKQQEYVRDIRASADHLTHIIGDILDMAKIESGRDELREEPSDVGTVVLAKAQMIRQRAAQKGVEVVTDLEPLPPYNLDRRKLGQMLLNLLSNAVKFTPPGGAVTVRAAAALDGALLVSVIDTGIGIPSTDLNRVLEPFTQVDSRLARQFEGTGLGLPLVKAMVEAHGGTLTLDSEVDSGTTATLRLPPWRRLPPDTPVSAGVDWPTP